jgi:hypothetical protein
MLPRIKSYTIFVFFAPQQTFMVNAKAKQLEGHVASKHAKSSPEECFPELPAMRADEASGGGGKSKKK